MRCKICDYSEGSARSPYNEIILDDYTHRRVRYDPETGDAICDHCVSEVRELGLAWEEETEETD